ncbi:hypothetical protein DENSPDRAFT_453432 [Dentipellis sp. KUC8613]|nr:hypothetical protein DENSPDRAFT_453432 [Dentipellis sp. KUC8613]
MNGDHPSVFPSPFATLKAGAVASISEQPPGDRLLRISGANAPYGAREPKRTSQRRRSAARAQRALCLPHRSCRCRHHRCRRNSGAFHRLPERPRRPPRYHPAMSSSCVVGASRFRRRQAHHAATMKSVCAESPSSSTMPPSQRPPRRAHPIVFAAHDIELLATSVVACVASRCRCRRHCRASPRRCHCASYHRRRVPERSEGCVPRTALVAAAAVRRARCSASCCE